MIGAHRPIVFRLGVCRKTRSCPVNPSRHGRGTDGSEDRSFLVVFALVSLAFAWFLPPILLPAAVVSLVYAQIQSGWIDFDQYCQQFRHVHPGGGRRPLARFGLTDIAAVCEHTPPVLLGLRSVRPACAQ